MHAWAVMEGTHATGDQGRNYRMVVIFIRRKDAEHFCRGKWAERCQGPPRRYPEASSWPGVWVTRQIIHEELQPWLEEPIQEDDFGFSAQELPLNSGEVELAYR